MAKLISTIIIFFAFISVALSQAHFNEGFEGLDTAHLPTGWSKFNMASFPIDPLGHWTVRDSGTWMPGLATALVKSHSGVKSCAVSWWTGIDTNTNSYGNSDAWLVTKKIPLVQSTDVLKFWACGGSPSWVDSMQIWVGFIDSIPTNLTNKVASITWIGATYGNFVQYTYSLSAYAGLPLWIGFRYHTDCLNQGFAVYLGDVFAGNPNSITNLGTGIPTQYALGQNYPNPFNPKTTIKFDLPKSSNVKLAVYNSVGQEVSVLLNEYKTAGYYEAKFDASSLSSGVYFYRIEAGNFLETKKMMIVK